MIKDITRGFDMRKMILPNLFLLIVGFLIFALFVFITIFCAYGTFFDDAGIPGIIGACAFFAMTLFWTYHFAPHCFGVLIVKDEELLYCGLCLPFIKLKVNDIKYVDIRCFDKGNVFYYGETVDAYKYMLISQNPLPKKRIDKIRPSQKNRLIKFALSFKLCSLLAEILPADKAKAIDYQLFLYRKAGIKK